MPSPAGDPTFESLAIPADLCAALARQHITVPTPIQAAALPVLLAGRDAFLSAPTGTGKTLAYLLPVFCRITAGESATQAVIVAPTHELALQIQRQCGELAVNAGRAVRSVLLLGGTSTDRQIEKLKKKPELVIGTPGRVDELRAAGKLKLRAVRSIVIDEADRLCVPENLALLRALIAAAPPGRQLVLASATPQEQGALPLADLAQDMVLVQPAAPAVNENLEHFHLVCEERDKPDVLRKLLHALAPERAMVFVQRSERAEDVAARLAHHGLPAVALHAAGDKFDRKQAMDDFRAGRVRVMVASDVAARGLDIPGVTHVVNLDVPSQSLAYLHRVGRSARAGARGQAVTLITESQRKLVRRLEEELGIVLQPVRLREGRMIPATGVSHRSTRPHGG